MENEIAELRAEIKQLRQHTQAMQGATSVILATMINAIETIGIDRQHFVDALKNSAIKGYAEDQTAEQTLACDLLMAFAQTTLANPNRNNPPPRPTLRAIDGGKT